MDLSHLVSVEHIQNVHTNCKHGPYTKQKKWLLPGTPAAAEFEELALKTRVLNQIKSMSSYGQTSNIECFHKIINHFAPKMIHFSYTGMLSRLYVAIMHYNENSERAQAVTKEGQKRYKLFYPKYKERHVVRKVLTNATDDYVDLCLGSVFANLKENKSEKHVFPPVLSHGKTKTNKHDAIAAHQSRFRKITDKVEFAQYHPAVSSTSRTMNPPKKQKQTTDTFNLEQVIQDVLCSTQ
ncbi:uncharacterized protein LOC141902298 [Tubulanus polymorphus]|uniref:uncharacterized protein LOC141902298 n=1 Tax=Tubulanus polymorphus TaxID=672921 RepID=UPI003DA4DA0F